MIKENKDGGVSYFHRTFKLGIYPWTVNVIFSTDIHATRNSKPFMEYMGDNPWPNRKSFAFCESIPDNFKTVIFFPYSRKDRKMPSFSIIAHEAFHCMYTILEKVGALDSEEAQAYLLEFIVEKIENMVNEIMDFYSK